MAEHHNPLTHSENQAITGTLAQLKARLAEAVELLADMHIDHALECLYHDNPINQQAAPRGSDQA